MFLPPFPRAILPAVFFLSTTSHAWTLLPFNGTLESCEIWGWHTTDFGNFKGPPFCAHRVDNNALVYAIKTCSTDLKVSIIELYFTDETYMQVGDIAFAYNSSALIEKTMYMRPHNTSLSMFIAWTAPDFTGPKGADVLNGFNMKLSNGESLAAGRVAMYAGQYPLQTPVRLAGLSGTVCDSGGVMCTLRVHLVTVLKMPEEQNFGVP